MNRHLLTVLILGGLIGLTVAASDALGIRLYDRIATNLCISLVLVLGLQVFMGNSGILSFAHMGFMGVGAYTSAVLTIPRSEEHTSELQSLMRISYAVFCLQKKKKITPQRY